MFGHRYFGAAYFGPRYWGVGGTAPAVTTTDTALPPGGIGHKRKSRAEKDTRRRRILLADGRIIVPRDDAEYRRIVAEIIAAREPEEITPPKRTKRRIKGAVVAPDVPKTAPVAALPAEFYNGLELTRQGVLNYLSILAAWQAYVAAEAENEEDTLTILLATVH